MRGRKKKNGEKGEKERKREREKRRKGEGEGGRGRGERGEGEGEGEGEGGEGEEEGKGGEGEEGEERKERRGTPAYTHTTPTQRTHMHAYYFSPSLSTRVFRFVHRAQHGDHESQVDQAKFLACVLHRLALKRELLAVGLGRSSATPRARRALGCLEGGIDKRGRGGRVKREGGGKEGGKELLKRGEGVTFFGFVVFPAKQVGVFVRFEVAEADNDRFRVEHRGDRGDALRERRHEELARVLVAAHSRRHLLFLLVVELTSRWSTARG